MPSHYSGTVKNSHCSGTVTNETENIGLDREIPKERCTSPEKKTASYWWSKINNNKK